MWVPTIKKFAYKVISYYNVVHVWREQEKTTSVRWKNLLDVFPSHATLQWLPWNALYGCPIYDSLVQTSLPRKPIGSSLCSRVTPTLISRLASPLRSLPFSTHVLSPLLSQRKSESDTRANYLIIPTRYKVPAKLVQLSGFMLFICGKQHNLTCLRLQVQRPQLGHIILPSSEIKSIYSANAQWLIKRW